MTTVNPLRSMAIFLVATTSALTVACRHDTTNASSTRACSTGQALSETVYRGSGMPPKTIALTFDDGPGDRTQELSHWLKAHGIRAGFFINGKNLTNGDGILKTLVADGHVIGNHTQTHPDLTTLTAAQVVAEVQQTDALIAPFVPDNRFMFRAPFGYYNPETFAALQSSDMKKYVGPIDWDMGNQMGPAQAADWDCWSPNGTSVPPVVDVKTCGDLYLSELRSVSSGIVLMHDPYFIDDDPMKGGTVDMVENIVPILQAEGFTFVRVDEVPSIAAVLPPLTTPPASADAGATPPPTGSRSGTETSGDTTDPCPPSPQAGAPKP